jgi:hypothetical protein
MPSWSRATSPSSVVPNSFSNFSPIEQRVITAACCTFFYPVTLARRPFPGFELLVASFILKYGPRSSCIINLDDIFFLLRFLFI